MIQKEGYNVARLSSLSPLNGYQKSIGSINLCEINDYSLVSLAIPQDTTKKFAKIIKDEFDLAMPTSVMSKTDKKTRLLMTQPDQIFSIIPRVDNPEEDLSKTIGKAAYMTDQTDAWVVLEISGATSRTALERICQVDLDSNMFKLNATARTTMEHMATIIIRTDVDTFLLMSASSSAKSFLHAVELSAKHIS